MPINRTPTHIPSVARIPIDSTQIGNMKVLNAEPTRLPTADELTLLREVIDPTSLRDKEVRV